MTLAEYLLNIGVEADIAFLREGIFLLTRLLIEADVSEQTAAGKY